MPCIGSKADALFARQCCRMLQSPDIQCYKHIKYWLGTVLNNYFPEMANGPRSAIIPKHFRIMNEILQDVLGNKDAVDVKNLKYAQAKVIYQEFTSSLVPPKIVFKFDELPFHLIWERLENPIMERSAQDLMFKIVNNIVPNRERFYKFGTHLVSHPWFLQKECHSTRSEAGPLLPGERRKSIVVGGLSESVVHQFTQCHRVVIMWNWLRGRIAVLFSDRPLIYSDFELLNLAFHESNFENELVWLISNYCDYIYNKVIVRNENANLDKLREHLKYKQAENVSQNRPTISYLPF